MDIDSSQSRLLQPVSRCTGFVPVVTVATVTSTSVAAIFIQAIAEATPMKGLAAIIKRLPTQELAIRRHYASDHDFKEACEDYVIANSSLERWQADETKAAEFRAMIEEIEQEITAYLERHQH